MTTPRERATEALTDLHFGHVDEEGYAELIQEGVFAKDAEVAITAAVSDLDAIAKVIGETSRKDEGTISATGANIVAAAVAAHLKGGAT
jgi:hypothetical protein